MKDKVIVMEKNDKSENRENKTEICMENDKQNDREIDRANDTEKDYRVNE